MAEKIDIRGVPEMIAVRERFLHENGSVFQIAASAMDENWTSVIEQTDLR